MGTAVLCKYQALELHTYVVTSCKVMVCKSEFVSGIFNCLLNEMFCHRSLLWNDKEFGHSN